MSKSSIMKSKDKKAKKGNKISEQETPNNELEFNSADIKEHLNNWPPKYLKLDNEDDTGYNYENKKLVDTLQKIKKELEEVKKENIRLKRKTTPINPNTGNIIELIQQAYAENKNIPVEIPDILPHIKSKDFIDLIIEKRIPFTSKKNSALAEDYCHALLYMSDKIKELKENSHDVSKVMTSSANEFASKMGETFDMLDKQKISTYGGKATYLNEKGIKTLRGKDWTRGAVRNTYTRWQKIKAEEEKNNQNSSPSKSPKP